MQSGSSNLELPEIYSFDLGLVALKLQCQILQIKDFYEEGIVGVDLQGFELREINSLGIRSRDVVPDLTIMALH